MVYDNGIKRPLVRAPNSAGVQRLITRFEKVVTWMKMIYYFLGIDLYFISISRNNPQLFY